MDGGLMTTNGTTARTCARADLLEKQALLEEGLRQMEEGLNNLGLRISNCQNHFEERSEIAHMAVNASRLERKFLSLRKKLKSPDEAPLDDNTREAIRELSEKNRNLRYNTRAIERETRRNSRILNTLAEKLKSELNKRRARDIEDAREKAAKVRLAQAPKHRPAPPKLQAVQTRSAEIVPFPVRGKR